MGVRKQKKYNIEQTLEKWKKIEYDTHKKKRKKTQERIALIQNKNVSPKKSMPL